LLAKRMPLLRPDPKRKLFMTKGASLRFASRRPMASGRSSVPTATIPETSKARAKAAAQSTLLTQDHLSCVPLLPDPPLPVNDRWSFPRSRSAPWPSTRSPSPCPPVFPMPCGACGPRLICTFRTASSLSLPSSMAWFPAEGRVDLPPGHPVKERASSARSRERYSFFRTAYPSHA
jgi:hypothetical protein